MQSSDPLAPAVRPPLDTTRSCHIPISVFHTNPHIPRHAKQLFNPRDVIPLTILRYTRHVESPLEFGEPTFSVHQISSPHLLLLHLFFDCYFTLQVVQYSCQTAKDLPSWM